MNLILKNKTALVGGGSKGIGKASAIKLAGLGARVILMARNEEELAKTLSQLPNNANQKHSFISTDFRNPELLKERAQKALAEFGSIEILVNNSGGPPGGPILNAEPEEFLAAFQQHLISAHILTRALVPSMKKEGFGRIVNIISTSVKQPIPGLGVSNTIRGAVANWSKTIADELAPFGITVNNVLPGFTDTERLQNLFTAKAEKEGKHVHEIYEAAASENPVKRIAKPSEVAAAVSFLCSPDASYITGTNLPVDGGRTRSL